MGGRKWKSSGPTKEVAASLNCTLREGGMHTIFLICLAILCSFLRPLRAASAEVTFGSCVKLQHERTQGLLHSHEISYGSGSGQQSVTADFEANDANSLWNIVPIQEENATQGTAIKNGARLRLQHAVTSKWLHSHHFQSPLSPNQEISAFGSHTQSDAGDVWSVSWDRGSAHWQQDQKIRLKHEQTGVYLASHDRKYGRPIAGQQEVCGKGKSDAWAATEGVYFPTRDDL